MKLTVNFGSIGYGFITRVLNIAIPSSWTTSKKVRDVINLACDNYNSEIQDGKILNSDEVVFITTDGQKVDPLSSFDTTLSDQSTYLVKLVCFNKKYLFNLIYVLFFSKKMLLPQKSLFYLLINHG